MADVKVSGLPLVDNTGDINPALDEMILNAGGSTETSRVPVSVLQALFGAGGGTDANGVPRHYWQLNTALASKSIPNRWSDSFGSSTTEVILDEAYKTISVAKGAVGGYLFYSMPMSIDLSGVDKDAINNDLNFDRYQTLHHKAYGIVRARIQEAVEFVGSNQSDKTTTGFNFTLQTSPQVTSSSATANAGGGNGNGNVKDNRVYSKLDYVRFPQSVIDSGEFNIKMTIELKRGARCTLKTNQCRFIFLPVYQEPSAFALEMLRSFSEAPYSDFTQEDAGYDPVAIDTAELSNQLKDAIQMTQHQVTGFLKEMQQRKDNSDPAFDQGKNDAAEALLDQCWDLYANKDGYSTISEMETAVKQLRQDMIDTIALQAWPWDTPSSSGYFQF